MKNVTVAMLSLTLLLSSATRVQGVGGQETFLTQRDGAGSFVESLLFNPTTGIGSSITVNSSAAYQFPVLLGNPKAFLDLVSAGATSVNVGIDLQGGAFQTD